MREPGPFKVTLIWSLTVLDRYLGERPKWVMSTGNNALANTGGLRQPVHKDTRFRHPKVSHLEAAS